MTTTAQQAQATLIERLCDADLYDHPVERFEVLQTHISWVILTGPFAYKIKKPVDMGFLDFTSLEQRRRDCERELALNRRLAADLYRDVVAITGVADSPQFGGSGEAIEYAVRMKQFAQSQRMDRLLAAGGLTDDHVDELARMLAMFHQRAPRADGRQTYGTPGHVWRHVRGCLDKLDGLVKVPEPKRVLGDVTRWLTDEHARLTARISARRAGGFVRDCHGDAHLENLAVIDGHVVAFDCIEFSDGLRTIDVASEIAYTMMDLSCRGAPELASRLLARYLEWTGDFAAAPLLSFYQCYRALVRAMVTVLSSDRDDELTDEARRYLNFASACMQPVPPMLVITRGPSGVGKTHITERLLAPLRAVRIRSDIERRRLFGMPLDAPTDRARRDVIYGPQASRRTYQRMTDAAGALLAAGVSVILDATFLDRRQRDAARQTAAAVHRPCVLVDLHADEKTLRDRVASRARARRDASEADDRVLRQQLAHLTPLPDDELATAVRVDASQPVDAQRLAGRIRRAAEAGRGATSAV